MPALGAISENKKRPFGSAEKNAENLFAPKTASTRLVRQVMGIEIVSTVAPKVGFASHQNATPILRELVLRNSGDGNYEGLTVAMTADPPFFEAKSWRVEALHPGTDCHIDDRDIKLNGGYLSGLTESLSGEVRYSVSKNGEVLASQSRPVELLARNHWGGGGSMPELLPAFCLPNDPAIDRVLKAAADILHRAGRPSAINGYESKSRERVWEIASAIWSAVVSLDISYALPPVSFEESGQKVRTPGAILEGRMATCLDSALLFASAFEQAGLYPVVLITKGHALVGAWLEPREFPQLITEAASTVRKRIDLKELVVFETTLALQPPVPPFSKAVEHGTRQLTDEDFRMAVDIRRARMQRIRPLAQETTANGVEGAPAEQSGPAGLEAAPSLPPFEITEVPTGQLAPTDRITLWLRKLLDLTARNRLLHLPDGAKCVPLLCPDGGLLEETLATGRRIKILPVPDLEASGRDAALYEQQTRESLTEAYAREALTRSEASSPLSKVKLEAELVDLYRKAHSDLTEGGANTLFLALGFLKWKKSAADARSYRAPLILLPIKLERRSAVSQVTMLQHEDEPRFNMTLLEMLRHDFELEIPQLEGSLPTRPEGDIDVQQIWNTVRHAVRDAAGFEVVTDVVLGTFSFAKYLMWKDLAERRDLLLHNCLVRHLLERTGEGIRDGTEFPRPEDLDLKFDASKLYTPLPADSSQLAAVVASASDFDFVLDGPPGTGKSQTIANMIAHNLALGRRVLFVAEKRAALDVVYRRLKERGLGDFCLEVHSNKTSKTEVVKQLERAWDTRDDLSEEEWQQEADVVTRLRDRLNGLVTLLHQRHQCGLTVHDAIGRVVRDGHDGIPKLQWPAGTEHDSATLQQMRDVAKRIDLNLADVMGVPAGFALVPRTDWSNDWQANVVAGAESFLGALDAMLESRTGVLASTELPIAAETEDQMEHLVDIGSQLLRCHGQSVAYSFEPDASTKMSGAQRAAAWITDYREHEKTLSVPYASEAVRRIDPAAIETAWLKARQKFWFLGTLAKKKVAHDLAVVGGVQGIPNVAQDLPVLRQMRDLVGMIDGMESTLSGLPGWSKLGSDIPKLSAAVEQHEKLHDAMARSAASLEHLSQLNTATRRLAVDANGMLHADGKIAQCIMRFESTLRRFQSEFRRFRELCGYPDGEGFDPERWRETANAVLNHRFKLKAWCDWCRVRRDAQHLDLAPLVEGIEHGAVPPGKAAEMFEVAYARWFATGVIDSEPILRQFVASEHLNAIEAFRKLNDRLGDLSTRYIRAKVCQRIPPRQSVVRGGGFAILQRELQKQRRHKPLRQLAVEMGDALTRLAPCMLMSPLSIAQYLPVDTQLFDLVIFDEASQIAPWDAIGAIARGKHVVIAGDPRQMPPTNFFARSASYFDADGSDSEDMEDMESILDECLGAGIPRHSLTWHYRSRHESLIAFSNSRYYNNSLITFPAATTRPSAVTWRKIDGIYARGRGQTNQAEAEAMVREVVQRLTKPSISGRQSLAIVTLNAEQQKLVEDLLDKARRETPEIEPFFSHEQLEPVVVKNLETVQGDERDVIMLGIGYGPSDPGAGTMPMNFGPLNRDGGWRRLNVAITRARQEMIVFSSFGPGMIDLNRVGEKARAVKDLKNFLEYADRGPRALGEAVAGSVGGPDSPFEEAVARSLTERGWQVVPQVGVSRFRIDLGIVHPDRPGDFLVGVECDGATYHRAATARDRDKVRAVILEGLGWTLFRVWSTDWWVDQTGSISRLHRQIVDLLEVSRSRHRAEEEKQRVVREAEAKRVTEEAAKGGTSTPVSALKPIMQPYRLTDFGPLVGQISPERFYDGDYDEFLSTLVARVIECEAPIADELLVSRIAGAHTFKKAGRRIRERVMDIAWQKFHVVEDPAGGNFVWKGKADPTCWNTYRIASDGDTGREIDHIPVEEIRAAVATLTGSSDPIRDVAQLFGVQRVTTRIRERLSAANGISPVES
jgi:very-short-patch-repair endonuclease